MKRIALLITGISLLCSSCQKTEAPVSVSPAVPQNVRLAADNASGDLHTLIFRWDEVSGAEKYNARLEDMEGNLLEGGSKSTSETRIVFSDIAEGTEC